MQTASAILSFPLLSIRRTLPTPALDLCNGISERHEKRKAKQIFVYSALINSDDENDDDRRLSFS
jgi:hypothetical protein